MLQPCRQGLLKNLRIYQSLIRGWNGDRHVFKKSEDLPIFNPWMKKSKHLSIQYFFNLSMKDFIKKSEEYLYY